MTEVLPKITGPTPARLFPRERLFDQLGRSCSTPATFISGPAGSGKTSLVTSYLAACQLPCLWYQVDAGDSDVASFFFHMSIAAKRAKPSGKQLPLLTPEYLLGMRRFTIRFFAGLYDRLVSEKRLAGKGKTDQQPTDGNNDESWLAPGSPTKFIIVFDDYHEVPEDSVFHEVVRDGLSVLPGGITAIIMSRSEPHPVFAEMQANRRMEVIGWDELKVRPEEAKGIVALLGRKQLPEKVSEQICEKAGGWAAGIVLLAKQTKPEPVDAFFEVGHTPKEIFNYFANVIFEKTRQDIRSFLEKTCFFSRFTPDMAKELTKNPQAGKILSDLDRNNYFTRRLASRAPIYEFHHLFREFLLARAQEVFAREELSRIRRDAAVVCDGHGYHEDAIEIFLESAEWADAARLILEQAPALFSQGRSMTLSGWIETVPEEIVRSVPYLLYWKGICYLSHSPRQAREYLQSAFHLFESGRDVHGLFLSWSGIVNSFLPDWDDLKPLDYWIDRLDKYLSDGVAPPPSIYPEVAVNMMLALTYRRPSHPDVGIWADRAMSLTRSYPRPDIRVQACLIVSTYNYFMGEEAQGILPAKEGQRIEHSAIDSPLVLFGMKVAEIIVHWLTAAPGSSSHLISEGLAIADKIGMHVYDSMLYSYAVCDLISRGDLPGAGELLKKMEPVIRDNQRCAVAHYHYLVGWYHLLAGDVSNAFAHVERGVRLFSETGLVFGEANSRILFAFVLQAKDETEKAVEQIRLTRAISSTTGSFLFEWLSDLADAWVAYETGLEASGRLSLEKAMVVGKAKGFLNCEGWLPFVMTKLCLKALESGIEVDYVRTLISKRGLVPDNPPYEYPRWPWPLRIHTLGRFEIMREEKALQYPVRAPRVPLALLKAIIAFGPGGVKEEQLVDALWPETEGDMAHQAFKTTLHRLRHLVGDDRAIQVREGRVVLDQQYCWVDAYAFEFLLETAEAQAAKDPGGQNLSGGTVDLFEKALALYRGAFLGEESPESWAMAYQERLRSKFIRAVSRLGGFFARSGQWDRAVECYQRGLEADQLSEEFYKRLMMSYLALERRAEAVAVYNRCRKVLLSVLGIDPSPSIEHIFRTIEKATENST